MGRACEAGAPAALKGCQMHAEGILWKLREALVRRCCASGGVGALSPQRHAHDADAVASAAPALLPLMNGLSQPASLMQWGAAEHLPGRSLDSRPPAQRRCCQAEP